MLREYQDICEAILGQIDFIVSREEAEAVGSPGSLIDRHCGRVRYDFYLRLQKSVNALSCKVDDVIKETLVTIELGINRALRKLSEGQEGLEASLAGLSERQSRMEASVNRLGELMDALMEVSDVVKG